MPDHLTKEKEATPKSPMAQLLDRCLEPLEELLYEYREEREGYKDYPNRRARFDRRIHELEMLITEVRCAAFWDVPTMSPDGGKDIPL